MHKKPKLTTRPLRKLVLDYELSPVFLRDSKASDHASERENCLPRVDVTRLHAGNKGLLVVSRLNNTSVHIYQLLLSFFSFFVRYSHSIPQSCRIINQQLGKICHISCSAPLPIKRQISLECRNARKMTVKASNIFNCAVFGIDNLFIVTDG